MVRTQLIKKLKRLLEIATPGPWFARYDWLPGPYVGWHIYRRGGVQEPVGLALEPIGGQKDDRGRSLFQTANAELLALAHEMAEQIIAIDEAIERLQRELQGTNIRFNQRIDKYRSGLKFWQDRASTLTAQIKHLREETEQTLNCINGLGGIESQARNKLQERLRTILIETEVKK